MMLTVEECIGKVALVRTNVMIFYEIYDEVSFIELSPSKEYVKIQRHIELELLASKIGVQWHDGVAKWLPAIDFVKRYTIVDILRDIDKEEK